MSLSNSKAKFQSDIVEVFKRSIEDSKSVLTEESSANIQKIAEGLSDAIYDFLLNAKVEVEEGSETGKLI